ncbi:MULTISPECIES: 2-hydroxyacid dehydrogenase [unclassified Brevundimonas]|uniref:2-hydroxyacid dehydrogenase n=1 Tax=unclassified Brevundimonas TaxID=2622653 RepID=UPI0025BB6922|nr:MULTISPECIES: 2-hydroxyacid dehydrogenase [unclassified Brevundimonas]
MTDLVLLAPGLPDSLLAPLRASGLRLQTMDGAPSPEQAEATTAYVVFGGSPASADLIDSLPNLKIIAVHGVGYDGVDVAHAGSRGVVVTNTPDVLTEDVADLALALTLNTLRALPTVEHHLRSGRWAAGERAPLTRRASGRRYGVLGLGRIGAAIARRLEPLGGTIAYHSRRPVAGAAYAYHDSARALARAVDVLIVATPGGPATDKLVDAEVLAALGPDGVLINIARGGVVDEDALIAALSEDRLFGAGLDVFAHEPSVPQGLLDHPRCVLTPHVGSATVETRAAMAGLLVENLLAVLSGAPAVTPVST